MTTSASPRNRSKDDKELFVMSTPENQLLIEEIRKQIIMPYTDDVAEMAASAKKSDIEVFNNADDEYISPVMNSPIASASKLVSYSTYMRLMNDFRQTGYKNITFAWVAGISMDTVLKIPLIAHTNGGWFFFIPFYFCILFLCLPIAIIEMGFGQLTTQGAKGIYSTLAPVWAGLGHLIDILRLLNSLRVRYNVVYPLITLLVAWMTSYDKRDLTCRDTGKYCYEVPAYATFDFTVTYVPVQENNAFIAGEEVPHTYFGGNGNFEAFLGRALVTSKWQMDLERLSRSRHPDFILSTMIYVFIIGLSCWLGLKMIYNISVAVVALTLLSFGLAIGGMMYQFGKDCFNFEAIHKATRWEALMMQETWREAIHLSLTVMAVGDGTLHDIGQSSDFSSNFIITIWSMIFYLTATLGLSLFVVYPVLFTAFPFPSSEHYEWVDKDLMNIVFSIDLVSMPTMISYAVLMIALMLTEIPYQVLAFEMVSKRILQRFPWVLEISSTFARKIVIFWFGILWILLFLIFTQVDFLQTLAKITIERGTVVVIQSEALILACFYGADRFYVNLKTMLRHSRTMKLILLYHKPYKFFTKYLLPFIAWNAAAITFFNHTFDSINEFAIGIVIILSVTYVMLVYNIIRLHMACAPTIGFLQTLGRWGPANVENRKRMHFDERAARIYDN